MLFENEKDIHYTKKRYVFFNFTVSWIYPTRNLIDKSDSLVAIIDQK